MPVQTVFRNVEFGAYEPFCEWRIPMENSLPRRAPNQVTRFTCPKFSRLVDRLSMHPSILGQAFDSRLLNEILRWLENALLNEVRLDIILHEQSLICRRDLFGKCTVWRCSRFVLKSVARGCGTAFKESL